MWMGRIAVGVGLAAALGAGGVGWGQAGGGAAVSAPESGGLSAEDVVRRDALMKPGLEALKARDYSGALAALGPALAAYPNDLRVLRYSAGAAMAAYQNETALELFHRALAQHPKQAWPLRLAMLQLEARLNRWGEFDRELGALRAAKKEGTDRELGGSNGFTIDEFEVGGVHVQGVVFPLLAGGYHTLYRFLLPKRTGGSAPAATDGSTAGGAGANGAGTRCENPEFQPYLDVESDDIDQTAFQKQHPEKAAKGERSYSLDTYGSPCSQGLIKFYFEGEPSYETVRADVMKALSAGVKGGKP